MLCAHTAQCKVFSVCACECEYLIIEMNFMRTFLLSSPHIETKCVRHAAHTETYIHALCLRALVEAPFVCTCDRMQK